MLDYQQSGLENIIFSKISKYRKYKKYHIFDIFDIFDIFQKMKISNKLYNNGCNTLMQYLMTSHLYHTLKLSFRRTTSTTLRSFYGISRPSVVCDVVALCPDG